ncbi:hypothetical protein PG996_006108 [Apiospora saccharicola]|uniref:Uncharacterized protein n=1 Tax=Apiospora saccharicola TaxID=335842 RepID=A0ABR1VND3_9PEZI
MAPSATEQMVKIKEVRQKIRDLEEKHLMLLKSIEDKHPEKNKPLHADIQGDIRSTLDAIKANKGTLVYARLRCFSGVIMCEYPQRVGITGEGRKRKAPVGLAQSLYKRYRTGGGPPDAELQKNLNSMTVTDMGRMIGGLLDARVIVAQRDFEFDQQGKLHIIRAGRTEHPRVESWSRSTVEALDIVVRHLTDKGGSVWAHTPKPLLDLKNQAPDLVHDALKLLIKGVHCTRLASNAIIECLARITEGITSASTIRNLVEALQEAYVQPHLYDILRPTGFPLVQEILRYLADEEQNVQRVMITRMIHAALMLAKGVCLGTTLVFLICRKCDGAGNDGEHEGVQDFALFDALCNHDQVYRLLAALQEEAPGHELDGAFLSSATYRSDNAIDLLKHQKINSYLGYDSISEYGFDSEALHAVLISPNKPYED